jgi:hypothetical protein
MDAEVSEDSAFLGVRRPSSLQGVRRGRPGLDTNGSDDKVRPKESDPIQP